MQKQRGFALIELWIVLAILGIIIAIIVPNAINEGEPQTSQTELALIQSAVNVIMAVDRVERLDGVGKEYATNHMDEFPSSDHPIYPRFLGQEYQTTQFKYWINSNNRVYQVRK